MANSPQELSWNSLKYRKSVGAITYFATLILVKTCCSKQNDCKRDVKNTIFISVLTACLIYSVF